MKKSRNILAVALAVAMACMTCTPTLAAEPVEVVADSNMPNASGSDNGIAPQNTAGWCTSVSGIGGSYKEVAYAPNGFNCDVILTMSVQSAYRIDVEMYSGGTKVWEEQNAFNGSRTFWCGNNITSIRVRVCDKLGGNPPLTYTCGVDVRGS